MDTTEAKLLLFNSKIHNVYLNSLSPYFSQECVALVTTQLQEAAAATDVVVGVRGSSTRSPLTSTAP